MLTASLPDAVTQNIEAIISLHNQEVQDLAAHPPGREAIANFFSQPAFLYVLVAGFAIWIPASVFHPFLCPFKRRMRQI
jgi:uncharacterized membrane protein